MAPAFLDWASVLGDRDWALGTEHADRQANHSCARDRVDAHCRRRGGGDYRVADRVVQELAARLYRARSEPVFERHPVDRAPRRQPLLRHRDGERRRLDGRAASGGGQGPRARLQRVRVNREGTVGRQHSPRQAGGLSPPRGRHLVAEPSGEETADRSGSQWAGEADRDRRHRHQRRIGRHRLARRYVRRRRSPEVRAPRCEAVVQIRAGALLGRDHARVVPRHRSGARGERAVGRRRGERRHDLCRQARASHGRELGIGQRRRAAVHEQTGLQPGNQLRQTIAAGNRASRAGAPRHQRAAVVRRQGRRNARSARRGDERSVVGGRRQREGRRRRAGAGAVNRRRRVGEASRSCGVHLRSVEERHWRRCASERPSEIVLGPELASR